jgi:hypothetical protein
MKVFVDWVVARRYRLILLAIALAPLLQPVAAALIGVETARRGAVQGSISSLAGVAGMLIFALLTGMNPIVAATLGLVTFFSGVVVGALLQQSGNLGLAFQGTVLLSFALVCALSLFGPDPRSLFEPVIAELSEVLRASGAAPEQVAAVEGWGGILLAAAVFSQLIGPLLLAYWWLCIASGRKRFGVEFRLLKLGRVLGVLATAVIVLRLAFDVPLVQNLTALALLAFVFQGLAVLHAWANAKRWHPGVLAPVYVLLITPFVVLVIFGLTAVGLVDNWFDLRASVRPQT